MNTAPLGEGLRPGPPYGGDLDASARLLSPNCPNTDPPAWLYWGYHCTLDKELRRAFAITCDDYHRLLAVQDGKCGACGKPQRSKTLAVDHDHDTHEIRGLLCSYCNRALSQGLVRYLANPPAHKVGQFVVPDERIAAMQQRNERKAAARRSRAATKSRPKAQPDDLALSQLDKMRTMTQGGA